MTTRARADRMTRDELATLYGAFRPYALGRRTYTTDGEFEIFWAGLEVLAQLVADTDRAEQWIGTDGDGWWIYSAQELECQRRIHGREIDILPEGFAPQRREHTKEEKRFYRLTLS